MEALVAVRLLIVSLCLSVKERLRHSLLGFGQLWALCSPIEPKVEPKGQKLSKN